MKITKTGFNTIIDGIVNDGMESGGLLGIDQNEIVTKVLIDKGLRFEGMKRCNYYPDIDLFNSRLKVWAKESIRFGGIYHIHFSNIASFSDGDMKYINEIISVLPKQHGDLYFPILLVPNNQLIPFRIEKEDEKTLLIQDELVIE